MELRRDVFQAIADPTRRAIIDMVAGGPTNVNSIADSFDTTRQAVSLHVKILAECGLLAIEQRGRQRICEVRLEKLREVNDWVSRYRQFWLQKLDALEDYLDADSNDKKNKHGKLSKRKKK